VTELSLFPDLEPTPRPPVKPMSADRRRTQRQRDAVAAGVHPLTRTKARPDLGTCGDCALRVVFGHHDRSYPKCTVGAVLDGPERSPGPYMTNGAATDCRAWWPACDSFVAKDGRP
jgi:hypothetical protein